MTTTLHIPDMSCGHCKASVQEALEAQVSSISFDMENRKVAIDGATDVPAVLAALSAIGFDATILAN